MLNAGDKKIQFIIKTYKNWIVAVQMKFPQIG